MLQDILKILVQNQEYFVDCAARRLSYAFTQGCLHAFQACTRSSHVSNSLPSCEKPGDLMLEKHQQGSILKPQPPQKTSAECTHTINALAPHSATVTHAVHLISLPPFLPILEHNKPVTARCQRCAYHSKLSSRVHKKRLRTSNPSSNARFNCACVCPPFPGAQERVVAQTGFSQKAL